MDPAVIALDVALELEKGAGDGDVEFIESSDCPMSSSEEEELDLALTTAENLLSSDEEQGETAAAISETAARIDNSLEDNTPTTRTVAAASYAGDVSDSSGDETDGDRERESRRAGRGRGVASRGRGISRRGQSTRGSRGGTRGRGGAHAVAAATVIPDGATSDIKSWQDDDQQPVLPDFTPIRPAGSHLPAQFQPKCEADFFSLFFTDDIVDSIVQFTNSFADAHIAGKQSYATAEGHWRRTTAGEIRNLIALLIYMGVVRYPHIEHYWSTTPLLHGSWARAIIPTRTRFQALLSFLHVVDHTAEQPLDKLRKVRYIYDKFLEISRELYQPHQSISIDERMVKSKARFSFKQYIKNKPVKFGVKMFALCDSTTSYMSNFKIYTGRSVEGQADVGLAHKTVIDLMAPYSKQGYHLYTDNFYTSPGLYTDLSDNHGTRACGTCQANRKGCAPQLKNVKQYHKTAVRGDMRYVRFGELAQIQWKDKRTVTVLSNLHSASAFVNEQRKVKENGQIIDTVVKKPDMIQRYNMAMGGVDKFEEILENYIL